MKTADLARNIKAGFADGRAAPAGSRASGRPNGALPTCRITPAAQAVA
jgi:hypothetical protein